MTSPQLHDLHTARGAVSVPFQGRRIVESYGDPGGEFHALRHGVALMDFSALGRLWIRGRDAQDYLHRQTSRDIRALAVGQGVHAVFMRGDGRLVGEMILHRVREHEFLALTMPACAEPLAATLEKFIFTEDCTVTLETGERSLISLLGRGAAPLVRQFLGWPPEHPPEFACAVGTHGGEAAVIAHTGIAGVDGFHLFVGAAQVESLWETLAGIGATPVGWDAINRSRIEAGIPLFGFDHDDTWIPTDAGLHRTLDFKKGCFPGQEVVAKIENIGHPRFALRGLRLSGEAVPPPGTGLHTAGREIGAVASGCLSPTLRAPIALAHLKWKWREPGQTVTVGPAGSGETAEVVELPFA